MKTCTQCSLEKPLDAFYLSRGKPASPCKACAVSAATERNRLSPVRRAAANAKWKASDAGKVSRLKDAERLRAMRRSVPHEFRADLERRRGWAVACGDDLRARERAWYAANREAVATKKRVQRQARPEATKAAAKRYRDSDLGRTMGQVRKHERRARELRATPSWYDREAVRQIFEVASVLSRSGVKFSVDHAVPLKGRNVCGLHVQDNLQVMPLLQNIRKWSHHHG